MQIKKPAKTKLRLDLDADDLEQQAQLKQLSYDPAANTISLEDMLLVEDDAPAIGMPEGATERSWFEHLHHGVMIRKDLVLDDARAFAGYLLFNGMEAEENDFPLHLRINGKELVRPPTKLAHPFAKHYYSSDWGAAHFDNWFVIQVPVGALRQGTNEILLWAESAETSWEIMVAADAEYRRGSDTRLHHPNRSAKSTDQGATWDFEHLGWKDELDGEYCIRLSLDRYAPEGVYVSPVIDLAEEAGTVKKRLDIEHCRLQWEVDVPPECSVDIKVRNGDGPLPASSSWSAFEKVEAFAHTWQRPAGRYLQFEVVMRTGNPLATPVLKGLSIETTAAEPPRESSVFYRLVELHNKKVIRPSVPFVHEDFAHLQDLRSRFELDRVVEGAATEFEAQLRLMRWSYEVPIGQINPYGWNYYDLPQLERDEQGRIKMLGDYEKRRREGHCLFCNLTLIAACLAMGYPARWVNVSTKHTYGHEVTEVWSNEFDKWVFLDATLDYYIYDPDSGIPMNLVEISERLAEIMPGPATWEHPIQWHLPDPAVLDRVRIACREGENRHTVWGPDDAVGNLFLKGHFQMPLRNDFASRPTPVPWRLSSNWGGDLFYCYYSETFPRKREYQRHTNRPQDFNPPLNRAELFLSEIQKPGVLRVEVDTETPCFETFLAQVDQGRWSEHPENVLEWSLHEGLNQLRVKTRNTVGVCGPESAAVVVMNN
jgi:hypothetical protein